MASRATEDMMDKIHQLTAANLIEWLESGDIQPAQMAQVIKFLKDNDISGVAVAGSPLAALMGKLPELTFDDVQAHL